MVDAVSDPAVEAFVRAGRQRRVLIGLGLLVMIASATIAWVVAHDAVARVVLRVEASDCSPNLRWVYEDDRGELIVHDDPPVTPPWQSPELTFQGRRPFVNVIATASKCANVECQILVDGRQVVREARPDQAACSLP
ncbi:MAG: hypothetical protein JNL82_34415 [Myxococcales bacterium]|nr:hypothetical protein [Myxococcales bacterium]